eukprot:gnl/MRDRNA2_/MRDRNA2_191886_c0_seq1.p1 gnl/MRDRNA2_/MRDRNA2_191886_c0~~gnl/MRDRNA2_/MRDRNA2_191886_c0_seq1.p1  ORF type:complete len:321 (+),score=63.81 gnl/MRDRNA2_/MRDRNA2_191886_c0_seq1:247-1209(+)
MEEGIKERLLEIVRTLVAGVDLETTSLKALRQEAETRLGKTPGFLDAHRQLFADVAQAEVIALKNAAEPATEAGALEVRFQERLRETVKTLVASSNIELTSLGTLRREAEKKLRKTAGFLEPHAELFRDLVKAELGAFTEKLRNILQTLIGSGDHGFKSFKALRQEAEFLLDQPPGFLDPNSLLFSKLAVECLQAQLARPDKQRFTGSSSSSSASSSVLSDQKASEPVAKRARLSPCGPATRKRKMVGQTSFKREEPNEQPMCIICEESPPTAQLAHENGVAHQCVCPNCADKLKERGDACPICREKILLVIKRTFSLSS